MELLKVIFITGPIGSGKSTLIEQLIKYSPIHKFSIGGILAKGINNQSGTKDYILCSISGKEELLLASRTPVSSLIKQGNYFFNPVAIGSGEKILFDALNTNPDVIIIDEIGPLELNGKGWSSSLISILNIYRGILILTIRETITEEVQEKFSIPSPIIFKLKTNSNKQIISDIMSLVIINKNSPGK